MEENLENMIGIDEDLDTLLEVFEDLSDEIDKIEPKNIPQRAAKDRMKEIIEGAFLPYLNEMIQCNQVFEQGAE
jgi:hypothetical protein